MRVSPDSNCISLPERKDSPFTKEYNEKGARIGKIAKMALHALTVTAAVATVSCAFTAFVITAQWIVPVMIVSAVALSILFSVEVAMGFQPFLKGHVKSAYNYVRATVVDVLAKLTCAALYPIRQTYFDPKTGKDLDSQTPILLVHGYLHNSSAWAYFRYRLKLAGYKNVFTIDLGNPFLSIEEYAGKVDKKVKEIQKLTGREDIQLIGHSMGGVVSSYYATQMAERDSIKSVITLGSPLKGTKLHGMGKGAKQMHYKSEFITSLEETIRGSNIPFYNVGSKTDLIIRPTSSTIIKKNKYTMFNDLGHASYLFSDRVIRHCLFFYDQMRNPL